MAALWGGEGGKNTARARPFFSNTLLPGKKKCTFNPADSEAITLGICSGHGCQISYKMP